ncbi:hypothetical protein [Sphingobium tyrosinilyticum]|uniref:Uncharacterized protein n=1 Tax=Sphingobium tyrosinilyticum TaxID=2715436 RepID=A0ABV9EWK6_9SPHN
MILDLNYQIETKFTLPYYEHAMIEGELIPASFVGDCSIQDRMCSAIEKGHLGEHFRALYGEFCKFEWHGKEGWPVSQLVVTIYHPAQLSSFAIIETAIEVWRTWPWAQGSAYIVN